MKKIVCYQILKGYVLKILLNVDNDSGGYIAVESDDSTTFEGSRRELSTARKT
jgi:hypothetical protein